MGNPASARSEEWPSRSDRDAGAPACKPGPLAPPRGRLFQLLWPITSYLVTNLTVTVFWVFFFVLNRTTVVGRPHPCHDPTTLLPSHHHSILATSFVSLLA